VTCAERNDATRVAHAYGSGNGPASASAQADADDDDDEDGDDEQPIALDQVPASVRQAAIAALPGFAVESAETETENGVFLYVLSGHVGSTACEVEVDATGKVHEIEQDEDDD
jgi:hypothetical protein